jgi:hypothetical protein
MSWLTHPCTNETDVECVLVLSTQIGSSHSWCQRLCGVDKCRQQLVQVVVTAAAGTGIRLTRKITEKQYKCCHMVLQSYQGRYAFPVTQRTGVFLTGFP